MEHIIVLDFGGQYNQLIARRIRDLGRVQRVSAVQYAGGEAARTKPKGHRAFRRSGQRLRREAPLVDPAIYDLGIPILGICYGMQLMTHQLGGKVERGAKARIRQSDMIS